MSDSTLPSRWRDDNNDHEVKCLDWWCSISKTYPLLFKVVEGVLSIFHGPQVESSFSVMGDVIDPKSSRMDIKTYDAIQSVKYTLRGSQVIKGLPCLVSRPF